MSAFVEERSDEMSEEQRDERRALASGFSGEMLYGLLWLLFAVGCGRTLVSY